MRISRVRLKGWLGPLTGLQISQLPWERRGSCRRHVTSHRAPRVRSHPASLRHHTDSCSDAPPRSALLTEDDWLGTPHTQHDLAAAGGSWRSRDRMGKLDSWTWKGTLHPVPEPESQGPGDSRAARGGQVCRASTSVCQWSQNQSASPVWGPGPAWVGPAIKPVLSTA